MDKKLYLLDWYSVRHIWYVDRYIKVGLEYVCSCFIVVVNFELNGKTL